jgi:hypothetical protein
MYFDKATVLMLRPSISDIGIKQALTNRCSPTSIYDDAP